MHRQIEWIGWSGGDMVRIYSAKYAILLLIYIFIHWIKAFQRQHYNAIEMTSIKKRTIAERNTKRCKSQSMSICYTHIYQSLNTIFSRVFRFRNHVDISVMERWECVCTELKKKVGLNEREIEKMWTRYTRTRQKQFQENQIREVNQYISIQWWNLI